MAYPRPPQLIESIAGLHARQVGFSLLSEVIDTTTPVAAHVTLALLSPLNEKGTVPAGHLYLVRGLAKGHRDCKILDAGLRDRRQDWPADGVGVRRSSPRNFASIARRCSSTVSVARSWSTCRASASVLVSALTTPASAATQSAVRIVLLQWPLYLDRYIVHKLAGCLSDYANVVVAKPLKVSHTLAVVTARLCRLEAGLGSSDLPQYRGSGQRNAKERFGPSLSSPRASNTSPRSRNSPERSKSSRAYAVKVCTRAAVRSHRVVRLI